MRFKLFGESLFSLCLVPMFFYCAATWMVFQFNRKFFSERAACLSAALMAFAPLDVQGFDLYPYAHKAAVGTYSMAAMILFFHMLEKEGREKLVCAAAFGLLSGVGLLNSEAYGMSLAFLAAAWICSDRGLHRKPEFLAFLTAFSVGFIPYLMLELRPFLARVLTGGFAGSFDRPPGLLSTLRVLSILAWPFREVLGEITGFLAGTAAFAVMIPGLMGKPGRSRLALRVLAGVVAGYAGVMIALGVGTRYYVFPAFAPAMALLGVALGAILERLSRGGGGQLALFGAALFAAVCAASLAGIVRKADFGNLAAGTRRAFVARGHCFYWPRPYPSFAGYKTETTLSVEGFARTRHFEERYHPPAKPHKRIFINSSSRIGVLQMPTPESHYLYGIDVTYLGLTDEARAILSEVPEAAREYAFKGLAVFFANDFLIEDQLRSYRSGEVDREIPAPYRRFFYQELGRRLRDLAGKDPVSLDRRIGLFPPQGRDWMLSGVASSRYDRPVEPLKQ